MKPKLSYNDRALVYYAKRRAKIRQLAKSMSHRAIADKYGVSEPRISQIVNGGK